MKNIILPFLLLSIPVLLSAQGSSKTFRWGITFNPNLSHQFIVNDGTGTPEFEELLNEIEVFRFGYAVQSYVEWNLDESFALQLGLGYKRNGSATKRSELLFPDLINPNPSPNPVSGQETRTVFTRNNVEIPLNLVFRPWKRVMVSVGTSGLIVLSGGQELLIYDSDGNVSSTDISAGNPELNSFDVTLNFGIGATVFSINQKEVFVQPLFQLGLFNVYEPVPLNRKNYNIGLTVGLRI
ncbi:MAG: outer membrane beta-barrel protein [Bacteroidota bacterium]